MKITIKRPWILNKIYWRYSYKISSIIKDVNFAITNEIDAEILDIARELNITITTDSSILINTTLVGPSDMRIFIADEGRPLT